MNDTVFYHEWLTAVDTSCAVEDRLYHENCLSFSAVSVQRVLPSGAPATVDDLIHQWFYHYQEGQRERRWSPQHWDEVPKNVLTEDADSYAVYEYHVRIHCTDPELFMCNLEFALASGQEGVYVRRYAGISDWDENIDYDWYGAGENDVYFCILADTRLYDENALRELLPSLTFDLSFSVERVAFEEELLTGITRIGSRIHEQFSVKDILFDEGENEK